MGNWHVKLAYSTAFTVQKRPIKMATTEEPKASFAGISGSSNASPTRTVPSPIRLVAVPIETIVPKPVGHEISVEVRAMLIGPGSMHVGVP